jgi:hypothetical protein
MERAMGIKPTSEGSETLENLYATNLSLNLKDGLFATLGAIPAPGTTQLCKRLFPEEIYLSIGLESDLPIAVNPFQGELPNLFGQQSSCLMNR